MKTLRRLSLAALGVAYLHLVFGAIVRITGSGMGCGDHWPKCYGHWFPPFDQPTLIIEWSHRLLAFTLFVVLAVLATVAWSKRDEPGVSGPGGVLRTSLSAPLLWIAPALLGALTVFLGNPPGATVAHWIVAMGLVAVITANAIRAGALGGSSARVQQGSARAMRSSRGAAAMALLAVAMGGLTAKIPFGAVACTGFPLCDANPAAVGGAVHVQMTHRVLAFLLFFHLLGVVMMMRRRPEAPVVRRAAWIAFGLVTLQLVVAASMILLRLPPVLRSMHEAVGVAIWIGTFTFAYLARIAARNGAPAPAVLSPAPRTPEAAPPIAAPSASAPVTAPGIAQLRESESSGAVESASSEATVDSTPTALEAMVPEAIVPEPVELQPVVLDTLVLEPEVLATDESTEARTGIIRAPVVVAAAMEASLVEAAAQPLQSVVEEAAPIEAQVLAPPRSPSPPHTIAVIVARGADL